jgi:hypothetical protein
MPLKLTISENPEAVQLKLVFQVSKAACARSWRLPISDLKLDLPTL